MVCVDDGLRVARICRGSRCHMDDNVCDHRTTHTSSTDGRRVGHGRAVHRRRDRVVPRSLPRHDDASTARIAKSQSQTYTTTATSRNDGQQTQVRQERQRQRHHQDEQPDGRRLFPNFGAGRCGRIRHLLVGKSGEATVSHVHSYGLAPFTINPQACHLAIIHCFPSRKTHTHPMSPIAAFLLLASCLAIITTANSFQLARITFRNYQPSNITLQWNLTYAACKWIGESPASVIQPWEEHTYQLGCDFVSPNQWLWSFCYLPGYPPIGHDILLSSAACWDIRQTNWIPLNECEAGWYSPDDLPRDYFKRKTQCDYELSYDCPLYGNDFIYTISLWHMDESRDCRTTK